MARPLRTRVLATFCAAFAPLACQVIADLNHPVRKENASDVTGDAAADGPDASIIVDPCGASFPAPVGLVDGPNLTNPLYFVFRYYDTATTPHATSEPLCKRSGFSLSKVTAVDVPIDLPAVDAGADATMGAMGQRQRCGDWMPSDGPEGIDNYAGEQFTTLVQTATALTHNKFIDAERSLESGGPNVMIQLTDYNGGANDPDVKVGFFSLTGLGTPNRPLFDAATAPDTSLDPLTWNVPWDRSTRVEWLLDETSVDLGGQPKVQVTGYVADHVLVAHAARMPILFTSAPVILERVTISGYLQKDDGGRWRINYGRIGGEVRLSTIRDAIAQLTSDANLCTQAKKIVPEVCKGADRGFPGRAACDAMSLAVSFTMVEGAPGELRHLSPSSTGCDVVCQ